MTLAVRIALSIVMLAVLVWRLPDVKWSDLGPRWTARSPWWMAGAILTTLVAYVFAAERWQRVLRAIGPHPRLRRLVDHVLAGQFVSNVLPTSFGGDVVRVNRLGHDLGSHPTAFASVMIDRLTGWLVLPLISATALGLQPELRDHRSATTTAFAIDIGTVVALVVILLAASNRRLDHTEGEPEGWRRFLVAVHRGVVALRASPGEAAGVLVSGAAFQVLQCLAVWMAAQAIGATPVTAGVALAYFPAAAIAQNLPVGFGGLGVREAMFVLFFGAVGTPRALAITLGLVIYAITIATSSLGAPSFVLGGRRGSQNPHTIDVTPPSGEP